MTKCVICGARRVRVPGRCHVCQDQIDADKRRAKTVQPEHFLTYRGTVVGLFPNGKENGEKRLVARLLKRDPDKLPKARTIDLNHWCDGFTREQIKRFKACVLKLAHA